MIAVCVPWATSDVAYGTQTMITAMDPYAMTLPASAGAPNAQWDGCWASLVQGDWEIAHPDSG